MSTQEYITLVSGDGFEFILPRSTACISGTIRRMLEPSSTSLPSLRSLSSIPSQSILTECYTGNFSESITGRCVLENMSAIVLEKVCEYFCYNLKNRDQANVPDMDIPPELCLELVMAADYLDT